MWYIHIEYYPALKWKEIPMHAITQMNVEDVLNKTSSQERCTNVSFHLNMAPFQVGSQIHTDKK